ncbi:MAG: energy transducer TonB, partial [Nitrospinae bacterium]|nr:energy transducer TonB [Nitrospinota bacterium]
AYPVDAARRGISGRLTLRFQISKDGNLMNVRLIDNSGYNILDEAALQAVKTAAPYYPFPVTIDRETLSILATFIYTPTYSTQYSKRR